eukprot:366489-Chlamydomonas_euryale.AAC.5
MVPAGTVHTPQSGSGHAATLTPEGRRQGCAAACAQHAPWPQPNMLELYPPMPCICMSMCPIGIMPMPPIPMGGRPMPGPMPGPMPIGPPMPGPMPGPMPIGPPMPGPMPPPRPPQPRPPRPPRPPRKPPPRSRSPRPP